MKRSVRKMTTFVAASLFAALSGCSSNPDDIVIVEATYGLNCKDKTAVRVGNATSVLAAACEDKRGDCSFQVDIGKLGGDPAFGCEKEFLVKFQCGKNSEVHSSRLDAEASGKTITLLCTKK